VLNLSSTIDDSVCASGAASTFATRLCAGQTTGVTDWRINEIAQLVEPDEAQRAAPGEKPGGSEGGPSF
jgi:hypothetical protein